MIIVYFLSVSQCLLPDTTVKDNITSASLPIQSLFQVCFLVYLSPLKENHLLLENTKHQTSHKNIPPCPPPSLSTPANQPYAPHYAKIHFNFKYRVSKWNRDEASTTHQLTPLLPTLIARTIFHPSR